MASWQEERVKALPDPPAKIGQRAFLHRLVIDYLDQICKDHQIVIKERKYSVVRPSSVAEVRAIWITEILTPGKKANHVFCWKNSYDKSVALALCAGLQLVESKTILITGEYYEVARRMAKNKTLDELRWFLREAISNMTVRSNALADYLFALAKIPLNEFDLKVILFDLIVRKIIMPKQFFAAYEAMKALKQPPTLCRLYLAFAGLLKDQSALSLTKRSGALFKYIAEHSMERPPWWKKEK